MSSDGNTVAISAYQDDSSKGSVYVYTRSGTIWTFEAKIIDPAGAINNYFGYSLNLSGDGNIIVIGAYGNATIALNAGCICIYTRSGTTWTFETRLTGSDTVYGDLFGISVSISELGTTIVAGASGHDTGGDSAGAAYVFTGSGNNWTQQAKLMASDKLASDYFGRATTISADGNLIAISSFMDDTTLADTGSVYIFTRSGIVWSQVAKLVPSDTILSHYFGQSVTVSRDGNVIAVCAYGDDTIADNAGAVYIYTNVLGTWTQTNKLFAANLSATDYFGYSLALDQFGNTLAIGVPYDDDLGTNSGCGYIFS